MARTFKRPIPFTPLEDPTDVVWNQSAMNGYWRQTISPDGPKYIWTKRPGLTLVKDMSVSNIGYEPNIRIEGMFFWERQNKVVVAGSGRVRWLDKSYTPQGSWTAGYPPVLKTGYKPYFADILGTDLYISGGGKIGKYDNDDFNLYPLTDAQAPTSVNSIATLDQYLIALRNDSERFDWADTGTPTVWSGEYSSAVSCPDYAKVILSSNNYLHVLGAQTYEPWYNSGSTFLLNKSGVIGSGIGAKDTAILIDGDIYYLDNTRRFSKIKGFQKTVLSNSALTSYIQSFSSVQRAWGMYLPIDGKNLYVVTFPDDEKTIVYDLDLNQFYNWSHYDDGEHKAWRAQCAVDAYGWGKVLIGDSKNCKVYELGGETDNGDSIVTTIRTQQVDHGDPTVNKVSSKITAVFERSGTNATPKEVILRWRDNGKTTWSKERNLKCESHGSTHYIASETMLGSYHTRSWELSMPDDSVSSLVSLTEEFSFGR